MRIELSTLFVDDQAKALDFYTRVLGFVPQADVPVEGGDRWLTVVSPEQPSGPQLSLEPNGHPAAKAFQEAIFADGIAATAFGVDDLRAEYERLRDLGVHFTVPPEITAGGPMVAVLDDTCGNLIQLYQV